MAAANFWTQVTVATATTFNIDANDGLTELSITVNSSGIVATTVIGTLNIDGNASQTISLFSGDALTITAGSGQVLDGLTVVTSSDLTTYLVGRQ